MKIFRTYFITALLAAALAGLVFYAQQIPAIKIMNDKGRDFFFRYRHTLSKAPSEIEKIVLIKLDDETLSSLSYRWPYPRSIYAQALDQLKAFKPKVVGFDMIFSGSDFSPDSDVAFSQSLKEAQNVVIGTHEGKRFDVQPSPGIAQSAAAVGLVDKVLDRDRHLRRVTFHLPGVENMVPTWEVAIFEKAYSRLPPNLSEGAKHLIDYRAKLNDFPQVSFQQLLEGAVSVEKFRNRIFLIGLTAEVFHDIHATPLGPMPGVVINANTLLQLIRGAYFSFIPGWATLILAFLSFWLMLLVATFSSFSFAMFASFVLAAVYLVVSFLLFSNQVIMDLWVQDLGMFGVAVGAAAWREGKLFFENLKLKEESIRDPLTNFYNRRFLILKLKSEFDRARSKQHDWLTTPFDLSVVMFDLDHFKLVNDTFGHPEGDRLLSMVAESVRSVVRKEELICRYGGDEFCVILAGTSIEGSTNFAKKICELIASNPNLSYRTQGGTDSIRVTLSVGVASMVNSKAKDAASLLEAADSALYRAKMAGRNQVCVYGT